MSQEERTSEQQQWFEEDMAAAEYDREYQQRKREAQRVMARFQDDKGKPIHVGDTVFKTSIDYGAPAWANKGTVVGFGRVRVRVQWHAWGYDDAMPYHATYPSTMRVIECPHEEDQ